MEKEKQQIKKYQKKANKSIFNELTKKKLPKSFGFFQICSNCAQKGSQFDMVCADKLL